MPTACGRVESRTKQSVELFLFAGQCPIRRVTHQTLLPLNFELVLLLIYTHVNIVVMKTFEGGGAWNGLRSTFTYELGVAKLTEARGENSRALPALAWPWCRCRRGIATGVTSGGRLSNSRWFVTTVFASNSSGPRPHRRGESSRRGYRRPEERTWKQFRRRL